jgi:CubicO group peptidase (beta-lactamase class C family)
MSWRLPFAAGAICATAQDLLKWERGLDEGRIISGASLLKMRQSTKLPGGVSIDYGFGTRLGQLQGHPIVGHTGSGGGYAAVLEHFPRDDLTIAVLTNTDSGPPASVAAAIARTALGLGQPRQGNPAPQPKTLAAVSGIYDSDEGPVELFSCGSRLCFRLPGATAAATPLKWLGDHRFAVDDDEVVQFLGGIGHPTWLEVYSGGLMMDAKQRVH